MSFAQLRREVNALQRKLVRELRVVRARRAVREYCDYWAFLVSKNKLPPDPFRLLRRLRQHTRRPGNFMAAEAYLNRCRERRHLPHPNGILFRLLPQEAALGLISYWTPAPVQYSTDRDEVDYFTDRYEPAFPQPRGTSQALPLPAGQSRPTPTPPPPQGES